MPKKERYYKNIVFTPEVIKEVDKTIRQSIKEENPRMQFYSIDITPTEKWSYDSEDEFFADYRKVFTNASISKYYDKANMELSVYDKNTRFSSYMKTREDVEKVFNVLEANVDRCRIPEPPQQKREIKMKIFIGHGHNEQWKNLKDHLHEKHNFDVEAYEIGVRAGLTIKEVLDEMLTSCSIALLVLTGEDLDIKGIFHPRENVIHELGLFQGRLGWRKAIVLLEDGVEEFSNIYGTQQIRFKRGNIESTFGEVLANIKREFEEKGKY